MAGSNYPDRYREIVDFALEEFFPPTEQRAEVVNQAMRYSLFSGGKRFRPILTLLTAEALGADYHLALPTACAFEFVHTYSLIHDDLPAIDDDDVRRGRPACHIKFGEDIAILAGDALLTEAFALIAARQSVSLPATAVVNLVNELAAAAGVRGMIAGQIVDITANGADLPLEAIEYIHSLKTGRLITAAARCGALIAGASPAVVVLITEFAARLGLAFQVTDDILDVEGSPLKMGKNQGSDAKLQKATFPSLLGLSKSRVYAYRLINEAKDVLRRVGLRGPRPLMELADFIIEREK